MLMLHVDSMRMVILLWTVLCTVVWCKDEEIATDTLDQITDKTDNVKVLAALDGSAVAGYQDLGNR